jgi:predicted translin family RNA/ssDNA-binding protein
MAKKSTIVIWFEREDYEAIKLLIPNEPNLCDTYEQWLEKTNKDIEKFNTLGFTVRKAIIDHEQFTAYCAAAGQEYTSVALLMFATKIDRENFEHGE